MMLSDTPLPPLMLRRHIALRAMLPLPHAATPRHAAAKITLMLMIQNIIHDIERTEIIYETGNGIGQLPMPHAIRRYARHDAMPLAAAATPPIFFVIDAYDAD